jgi:hypothetical protein
MLVPFRPARAGRVAQMEGTGANELHHCDDATHRTTHCSSESFAPFPLLGWQIWTAARTECPVIVRLGRHAPPPPPPAAADDDDAAAAAATAAAVIARLRFAPLDDVDMVVARQLFGTDARLLFLLSGFAAHS